MHPAARHFKNADPILYRAITSPEWQVLKRRPRRFAALCRIIIGQQVSTYAAASIYAKFTVLFPRKQPQAALVLAIDNAALRNAGLSAAKCASIRDLAAHVVGGRLPLSRLHTLDDERLITALVEVRGIGKWSAEMFMIFTLGREDIFSSGDLGLRNAIQKLYALETHPTPKEAEAIAAAWSPYRSYACRILWDSLRNTPS